MAGTGGNGGGAGTTFPPSKGRAARAGLFQGTTLLTSIPLSAPGIGYIKVTLTVAQAIISGGSTTGAPGPRLGGGSTPAALAPGKPRAGKAGTGGIRGDPAGSAGVTPCATALRYLLAAPYSWHMA